MYCQRIKHAHGQRLSWSSRGDVARQQGRLDVVPVDRLNKDPHRQCKVVTVRAICKTFPVQVEQSHMNAMQITWYAEFLSAKCAAVSHK